MNVWMYKKRKWFRKRGGLFMNDLCVSTRSTQNGCGSRINKLDNSLFFWVQVTDRIVIYSKAGKSQHNCFSFRIRNNGVVRYSILISLIGFWRVVFCWNLAIVLVRKENGFCVLKVDLVNTISPVSDRKFLFRSHLRALIFPDLMKRSNFWAKPKTKKKRYSMGSVFLILM